VVLEMLIGEFEHSLDAKGRVAIPTKFREDIGGSFFITKGIDSCLFVLPCEEWKIIEKKIRDMPISKARTLQRFFFSGAVNVETDKQGRVLIPANLRAYANLKKDVTFVGVSSRVEIWNSDDWKELSKTLTKEDALNAMDLLGL
jgi:MraZ protein